VCYGIEVHRDQRRNGGVLLVLGVLFLMVVRFARSHQVRHKLLGAVTRIDEARFRGFVPDFTTLAAATLRKFHLARLPSNRKPLQRGSDDRRAIGFVVSMVRSSACAYFSFRVELYWSAV